MLSSELRPPPQNLYIEALTPSVTYLEIESLGDN